MVVITAIGFLGAVFGLRWLLAAARLASLGATRQRGRGRGHFFGREDRRRADRVFLAVVVVGAVAAILFRWRWAPWASVALAGPASLTSAFLLDRRRARRFEADALSVLEALRGLVRSGAMSPPAALARIGRLGENHGNRRLRSRLQAIDRGETFEGALRRFARKLGDSPVAATFRAVAEASQAGLPILAMLDRALPELRAQALADEKLRAVRARAVAQAVIASLVPWGLSWLFVATDAGVSASNDFVLTTRLLALALEGFGIAVAWRLTCFR